MDVQTFTDLLDSNFYTGVPDSQLKPLCNYLMNMYGISDRHIIAANEGNAVALAAGYHLATGKIPVVYMQNSGIGNIINPSASLLNDLVYAIPCIFVVGWRGEPGVHDEPQHIYQGKVTLKLLEDMDIMPYVLSVDTTVKELTNQLESFRVRLCQGKSVAFVIRKNALTYSSTVKYENSNQMMREEVIRCIAQISGDDIIVSTTGKASRELFEIREAHGQTHKTDFLTVGSMGHSSSIALGIALRKPGKKVWCIDGDGAFLMHMGSLAVIGAGRPTNMIHVVINNEAHETVGGMPTVTSQIDLPGIATACGYPAVFSVKTHEELESALKKIRELDCLSFLEVKCSISSRTDLGRPTTSTHQNKNEFMEYLADLTSDMNKF